MTEQDTNIQNVEAGKQTNPKPVTIKMGRIIEVENTNKINKAAKDRYLEILVEDQTGKNEFPLMFTKKEIEAAIYRAKRNPEDVLKKNWLQDLLD